MFRGEAPSAAEHRRQARRLRDHGQQPAVASSGRRCGGIVLGHDRHGSELLSSARSRRTVMHTHCSHGVQLACSSHVRRMDWQRCCRRVRSRIRCWSLRMVSIHRPVPCEPTRSRLAAARGSVLPTSPRPRLRPMGLWPPYRACWRPEKAPAAGFWIILDLSSTGADIGADNSAHVVRGSMFYT